MIVGSLEQYLPLSDLWRIVIVCVAVALVAPTAVSVAIGGLQRRSEAIETHSSAAGGNALIAAGCAVVVALIGVGLYTLFNH